MEKRLGIRRPSDWISGREMVRDELARPGETEDLSAWTISWSRRFQWPDPQPAPQSVRLVVEGFPPSRLHLNDQLLPPLPASGSLEVLNWLNASNHLVIETDWVDFNGYLQDEGTQVREDDPRSTAVFLEISDHG